MLQLSAELVMHKFPVVAQNQGCLIRPTSSRIRKTTEVKTQTSGFLKQPTLSKTFAKHDKLPRDGKKALAITEKIGQFTVPDDQSLSVVSNVGFKRLIEHLEPRYIMPCRHYIVDNILTVKNNRSELELLFCTLKVLDLLRLFFWVF